MILEIGVFNLCSAIKAAEAGADRIELCSNIHEGGTTSAYGILKLARERISIPLFPMIRPRGGDFLYNDEEYESMKYDIEVCKTLGFEGVVFGLLKSNGEVDVERTKRLVELAYPMEVSFHRAFDRSADPFKSLENIINCGCQRLLTSGQVPNAYEGKNLIKQLIIQADDRIVIMPGSGVRSENIVSLAEFTGAKELHTAARSMKDSNMQFINPAMKEHLLSVDVDIEEIKRMKKMIANKPVKSI